MEDWEQLVIKGLEIEKIEKAKAAERRLLTKKNGLRPEEAKYIQTQKGQTRDIVAKQIGISGRQWEKIRYIYLHKEKIEKERYETWNKGELSTSAFYDELNRVGARKKNKVLTDMQRDIGDFMSKNCVRSVEHAIKEELFNHRKQKDKILSALEKDRENTEDYLWKIIEQLDELKSLD